MINLPKKNPAHSNPWWVWIIVLLVLAGARVTVDFVTQVISAPGWKTWNTNTNTNKVHDYLWDVGGNGILYGLDTLEGEITIFDDSGSVMSIIDLPLELKELGFDRTGTHYFQVDSLGRIWVYDAWQWGRTTNPSAILAVYDRGTGWKVFHADNYRQVSSDLELILDHQNRAWVGTNYGLAVINPVNDSLMFSFQNFGLATENILGFTVSDEGQLWVDVNHELMSQQADGSWKSHSRLGVNKDYPGLYFGMFFDPTGNLWIRYISSNDHSIKSFKFDRNGNPIESQNELIATDVMDGKGRFWYVSPEGLFVHDKSLGWVGYPFPPEMRNFGYFRLDSDTRNRIWMNGWTVYFFDPSLVPSLQTFKSLDTLSKVINLTFPCILLYAAWKWIRRRLFSQK